MEELYNDVSKNPEILSLSDGINTLVKKRESLIVQEPAPSKFTIKETEEEIAYKQSKLRSIIFEYIHKRNHETENDTGAAISKEDIKQNDSKDTELSPIDMESLLNKKSDAEEIFYYTIIAKDHARKELPDLVEAYPNHFYYAIICIEAEDGQYVKIVQDENRTMPYYPELDQTETQAERIRIMSKFLENLPDRYIHATYEDLFGESE